jgi:hypothetical protein
MSESFVTGDLVVPGTYVRVDSAGLIGAPAVSSGNIGIVGTASKGQGQTRLLSSYGDAAGPFGPYDAYSAHTLNLSRALEVLYRNGAGTVYARAVAPAADQPAFEAAFQALLKEDVNILVAPELSTKMALDVLTPLVSNGEGEAGKDMMAVVGSDVDAATNNEYLAAISAQTNSNPRVILTTPGIEAYDAAEKDPLKASVLLSGSYGAAAVAGLLSTLAPQSSPTNKVLPGVGSLAHRYTYGDVKALTKNHVLVLERRNGVRVVRGITTDPGPFRQITTRRIVDYAKAGIRGVSDPFVGRLNNARIRKALQGAIDGFLTSMLVDEALVAYELSVTATRDDEINGRAMVNVILQPTFSIDFVAVTLVLQ